MVKLLHKYYPQVYDKEIGDLQSFISLMFPLISLNQNFKNEMIQLCKQRKRFWGFDAKDSDMPPTGVSTSGRANPSLISYLYLSEDKKQRYKRFVPI